MTGGGDAVGLVTRNALLLNPKRLIPICAVLLPAAAAAAACCAVLPVLLDARILPNPISSAPIDASPSTQQTTNKHSSYETETHCTRSFKW